MPLPAALVAKLAKRGIASAVKTVEKENKQEFKVAACCPNKYNIYHECTSWCQFHWKVQNAPDPKYNKNMKKLLERYPLPKNCTELFDNGVGRFYYWDLEKNLVSWLPPNHPKAVQSEPAAKLRQKLNENEARHDEQQYRDLDKRKDKHKDRRDRDRDRDDDRKYKYERDRNRKKRDDLDPMDPAAYSDIPRGGWSDGLENNKSKADSTASGALFQQRPYPSPGDVLEANKQKISKRSN